MYRIITTRVLTQFVQSAVAECNRQTDSSQYEKALWLHDWLLDQLEYDNTLKWSSAESALTRELGTCQSYESAYAKLLTAAGIENSETRDTYDGHTWNAMKLDGQWYQTDCTWDDSSDNWYSFDQRHLYFGLTDELMAIAHPGHSKSIPQMIIKRVQQALPTIILSGQEMPQSGQKLTQTEFRKIWTQERQSLK